MKYLLIIVLLFSFNQARADTFYDGNKMLALCEAYIRNSNNVDIAEGNACFGYVTGIVDMHDTFVEWKLMSPYWCMPDKMNGTQLVRVVTKHLQEFPEDLHLAADSLVARALYKPFPCE